MWTASRLGSPLRAVICSLAVAALVAGARVPAHAIFGKVGTEFQVNTTTTGSQYAPAVACETTGGFLVIWGDAPSSNVRGQRYVSSGATIGAEFQVNAETTGGQTYPAVAATSVGAYVVVWEDSRSGNSDVFGNVVIGSAPFFPSDTPMNTFGINGQYAPAVAIQTSGGAVIVWNSDGQDGSSLGIYGQRRDAFGAALGTEFQVNTYTTGAQYYPSVAARSDGGFIVAWSGQDSAGAGVVGQVYNSSGAPIGGEIQVNTYTTGTQRRPSVATDASGVSLVVWQSDDGPTGQGIFGRRFDSGGTAIGTQFTINDENVGYDPSVASGPNGFLVAWSFNGGGDIHAQRVSSSGTLIGGPIVASGSGGGTDLQDPSVGADANGGYVVAWAGDDADQRGIFAQRFGNIADLCPAAPTSGCRTANKSVLLIKDNGDDTKDKLIWKWIRGASTLEPEFGDPSTSRSYSLCVYDGSGRLISADVGPDPIKWQDLKYKDSGGSADGIQKIILKPSATGTTKVLVKGKGNNLPDATLGSLTFPVTAQVINDETSLCFEATYAVGNVIKNDATQFKAKSGT